MAQTGESFFSFSFFCVFAVFPPNLAEIIFSPATLRKQIAAERTFTGDAVRDVPLTDGLVALCLISALQLFLLAIRLEMMRGCRNEAIQ